MKTELFDYDLPREFIAQHPAERRDRSKLLVLRRDTGATELRTFADLPEYVGPGDTLVVNDTRVIRARLCGRRSTGGTVEMLLVRPARDSATENTWEVMLNCRGRLRDGEEIVFADDLSATLLGRAEDGTSLAELRHAGDLNAALGRIGRVPLPPYIKRPKSADPYAAEDAERYQTVYAAAPGAVAAPTAGLHFTPGLLDKVKAAGCEIAPVTLHVGPGTFKPVRAENIEEHEVDAEYYVVTEETAAAVNRARRVIAVGTTSCRVLETLAAGAGPRITSGEGVDTFATGAGSRIRSGEGVDTFATGAGPRITSGEGWTELFIRPPYDFRVVDCLITNFHLPRSSLLMLVSAFATREMILDAYEEAKRSRCRFYSYGDAMLIS